MIKELILPNNPRRYMVFNDKYLVMITYEKFVAEKMEAELKRNNYDSKSFPTIHKK